MNKTCIVQQTNDPNVLKIIAPFNTIHFVQRGEPSGFWLDTEDGKRKYMGEDAVEVKQRADDMWMWRGE